MLLDEPERRSLETALNRAAFQLGTRAAMAGNSQNFGRTATNDAINDATAPGILGRMLGAEPIRAGQEAMRVLSGQRASDIAGRQDVLAGELACILTQPRGPHATGILDQLLQSGARQDRFGSVAGSVPFGSLSQTGLLALLPALNERSPLVPRTP